MATTQPRPTLRERDAMLCRACGREERASEGYPCESCGTFVCLVCTIRGVTMCRECVAKANAKAKDS
ncbi:MAG: hypothetical protein IPP98_12290 [Gemmatimonadetes bacterium]|nr:hypothetical protein [Gemmatimonadota bacterium]MBL0179888.1 hypothetical protein [Gemmatimonadota bacterium]